MSKVLCYGCKFAKWTDYDNEDGEPIMECTKENDSSSSWIECDDYMPGIPSD